MADKDGYGSTLHAMGFRRAKDGKLTHPTLVAAAKKLGLVRSSREDSEAEEAR